MQPVERMKGLVNSLPNKDRDLANTLIDKRKFEDLWDLITSAIYKVRRNGEKYPETNLADMNVLKSEVSSYMDQLGLGDDEEFEDEEEMIDTYEEY